ncbi:hypothetical protein [Actinoplanes missouriensis]|uniref:hypothetical protein n=1 Tax=Actinoplanes missouriensis TaxID=1866 RepID=UPI0012F7A48E|nr:hypothetical protein [Actinoplanes missouriensis]
MKIGVLEWVARRRVLVLAASLVVVAVFEVLHEVTEIGDVWFLVLAAHAFLMIGLIVYSGTATRLYHPPLLVARPDVPAFDVPASPGPVLAAAGFTIAGAKMGIGTGRDVVAGVDVAFGAPLLALWLVLIVALWVAALGRNGVRLRPDGIVDRQIFGSLFVPWEALSTPHAAYAADPYRISLFLAHPERTRRRGLRAGKRTMLPATGVDAELLARAIHEYANRPDLRDAIGSPDELNRFLAVTPVRGARAAS